MSLSKSFQKAMLSLQGRNQLVKWTFCLATLVGVQAAVAQVTPAPTKSKGKAVAAKPAAPEINRESAVQAINEPPVVKPVSRKSASQEAAQTVAADKLMMKFEDPNPPRDYRREMQLELSMGPFQAKGAIRKSIDESVGLQGYSQGRFVQLTLGTSTINERSEIGFVPSPWQWGMGAKFLLSQQDASIESGGDSPRKLQSAALTFGPSVKRRLTPKWTIGLGLEAGYFNYSQLSTRTTDRASQGTAIYGFDIETAVSVTKTFDVVAHGLQRQKMAKSNLELPEAQWSLGGRYRW